MTRFPRLLSLALLAVLVLAVPAHARPNEEVTFEAPRDLFDPGKRDPAFETISSLGVHALRVVLYWHDVAPSPDSRIGPRIDLTDPANYDWSKYQPVLDEAARRGWTVQLTVSGPVPRWATNGARHFGAQVTRWSIWNEPNHPQFLGPQYDSRHRPASPAVYRGLYAAALRGLAAVGDTKPVLMGETAPVGTTKDVAPLTFLRQALCLSETYKKVGKCSRLRVDGYAHHAYSTRQGPYYRPASKNFVTIGVLPRLVTALDRAARARVVKAKLPIYLTEFGVQSVPDPYYGVSYQRQNEFRAYSEQIAFNNSRVAAFSQYLLTDDLPGSGRTKYGGFESGLLTSAGKPKPALAGFRLPVVAKIHGSKVSLWGIVRPATGPTTVIVEQHERGRAWHTLATVSTNAAGVWRRSAARGPKTREWRVRWTAPDGTEYIAPPVRALK
jgi:hypothetical protein